MKVKGRTYLDKVVEESPVKSFKEKKKFDSRSNSNPGLLGQFQYLNIIKSGPAFNERLGNVIEMSSLDLIINVIPNLAKSFIEMSSIRITVLYDNDGNSVPLDLFGLLRFNANTIDNKFLGELNPEYLGRYIMLYDDYFGLPGVSSLVMNEGHIEILKINIPLKGLKTVFRTEDMDVPAGANVKKGGLMILFSPTQDVTETAYTFNCQSRVSYIDI